MFTGLVQDIGTVRSVERRGDTRIVIETALDLSQTPVGASVCCSGVCLTVVQKGANWFSVDVSQETLSRSGVGLWITGTRVNLEPSLKLGDELGGHFVFGHVDGQALIKDINAFGNSFIFYVTQYKEGESGGGENSGGGDSLLRFIAEKGSVTLDGVSLTVNEVRGEVFTVNIIPHTFENTTLGFVKRGDKLNMEIDMLARYVARALDWDKPGKGNLRDAA